MGLTEIKPAGFDNPGVCIYCNQKGEMRRLRCSNGTFQFKLYCPTCGNTCSSALSKSLVTSWGYTLDTVPIHDPDTVQRPPNFWDDRPDCPVCETPCTVGLDDKRNNTPVWACRQCGWSGGFINTRLWETQMAEGRTHRFDSLSLLRLRALAHRSYADYLLTDHWRRIRWARLWMANAACELCLATDDLQVHHKTYSRLAEERPEDLIVLCRRCHEHFHSLLPQSQLEEDEDAF